MQKLTFLPTLLLSCLLTVHSAEVNFSGKADQYTLKLRILVKFRRVPQPFFRQMVKTLELEQEIYLSKGPVKAPP
jgi:hypothetical protein